MCDIYCSSCNLILQSHVETMADAGSERSEDEVGLCMTAHHSQETEWLDYCEIPAQILDTLFNYMQNCTDSSGRLY